MNPEPWTKNVLRLLALLLLLLTGIPASGQSSLTMGIKGVYGYYHDSVVYQYYSARADLFYKDAASNWGVDIGWKRTDIIFDQQIFPDSYINHLRLALNKTFASASRGSLSLQVEGGMILATDPAIDTQVPLFASMGWLSPGYRYYLDISAHHFSTDQVDKLEVFPAVGLALFNYYVWAQIAFHYSQYSQPVQNLDNGWSVNPEITWYVIPKKLTVTAYGIFGEQVFSYNPRTLVLYTGNILLERNAGLTAYYRISGTATPYGDIQYERYHDHDIDAKSGAFYFTLGLFYTM